jgi:hypothetical protein
MGLPVPLKATEPLLGAGVIVNVLFHINWATLDG